MTEQDQHGLTATDRLSIDLYKDVFVKAGWAPSEGVINTVIAVVGEVVTKQLHLVVTPHEVLDATANVLNNKVMACTLCGHAAFLHDEQYNCIYLTDELDPSLGLPVKCGCANKKEQ